MSGIYIPGFKKPTITNRCKFFDYAPFRSDYCALFNVCNGIEKCPIIEVPDHGRLIDADALVEILLKVIDINASIEQRNEATEQERRCLWWFEQQIGIAPTIIPAEEDET